MSFAQLPQLLPETTPPAPSREILYNTATGDPQPAAVWLNAVPANATAGPRRVVTESSHMTFAAELFHFSDRPRSSRPSCSWRPHELMLTPHAADRRLQRGVTVEGPRVRVPLQLPARR
jgi:hypothetical protein